jgi:signal transduction histidine kinase
MADRLGAFGGTLDVRSAAGTGTTITGTLPL